LMASAAPGAPRLRATSSALEPTPLELPFALLGERRAPELHVTLLHGPAPRGEGFQLLPAVGEQEGFSSFVYSVSMKHSPQSLRSLSCADPASNGLSAKLRSLGHSPRPRRLCHG